MVATSYQTLFTCWSAQRELDVTVMRAFQIPHISLSAQGYINHDKPTDLSNCWNWSPHSVILVKVTVTGGQYSSHKNGDERYNNMIHNGAMIHAMLCTFTKNLYLICCDVPFVFVCAWIIQRSHGAKQREHKEIINGDQYGVTPVRNGEMVVIFKWQQTVGSATVFVNSCRSSQSVSVCPLWRILVRLPAYQMIFTQNN